MSEAVEAVRELRTATMLLPRKAFKSDAAYNRYLNAWNNIECLLRSIVSRTADATLIMAFLVEYNKAMLGIRQLEAVLAKEPDAGSSNGRTADFESANRGSSPRPATSDLDTLKMVRENLRKTESQMVSHCWDAAPQVYRGAINPIRDAYDYFMNSMKSLDALIARMELRQKNEGAKAFLKEIESDDSEPAEDEAIYRELKKEYAEARMEEERLAAKGYRTDDGRPVFGGNSPHDIGEHLARMEQNTGTSGMAAGKTQRHAPEPSDSGGANAAPVGCMAVTSAPAASDVDELVRKVEILSTKAIVEVRELRDLIRAHFAGEKHHG